MVRGGKSRGAAALLIGLSADSYCMACPVRHRKCCGLSMFMSVRISQCFCYAVCCGWHPEVSFLLFPSENRNGFRGVSEPLRALSLLGSRHKAHHLSTQRPNGSTGIDNDRFIRPPPYRGFAADMATGWRVLSMTADGHRQSRTLAEMLSGFCDSATRT